MIATELRISTSPSDHITYSCAFLHSLVHNLLLVLAGILQMVWDLANDGGKTLNTGHF